MTNTRILVLTNFYPPYAIGGMEHRCQEVVEGLRKRGHEIQVLTTKAENSFVAEDTIYRSLTLENALYHYRPIYFFTQWPFDERQNLHHLQRRVDDFDPEIIFIWGMWNLSPALAHLAEKLCPHRVVYSIAQDWPLQPDIHTAYWTRKINHTAAMPIKYILTKLAAMWLRQIRGNIELQFKHNVLVSKALQTQLLAANVPLQDVRIIYPGIDLGVFRRKMPSQNKPDNKLHLLYAGNLAEHKGVHTAIEAVRLCLERQPQRRIHLTIVGDGHPDYKCRLVEMVVDYALEANITFADWVSRGQMPQLLSRFHVLVFPSIWAEPFSRMILEAMASGLVVVGSRTGGTMEILQEGVNSLTFEAGDAAMLAKQLDLLVHNDQLRHDLAQNGQQLVVSTYGVERMIDEIEHYLYQVLGS